VGLTDGSYLQSRDQLRGFGLESGLVVSVSFGARFDRVRCRRELGWNFFVASLRWADDIYSGGQINRLSNELAGEGLPAVDLAHADLP
jgi:hypothetical protein